MSKIALQGDASGTGTFTIASPNSNTDRTLTLPDEAGTVLTSASTISGLGSLTEADVFNIESFVTASADPITTWVNQSEARLGTGVTFSSGYFSFPSTGYWLILLSATVKAVSSGTSSVYVQTTTDNSTYSPRARGIHELDATGGSGSGTISASYVFDVTDTANCKVKTEFVMTSSSSSLHGSTDGRTSLTFIRLGDT